MKLLLIGPDKDLLTPSSVAAKRHVMYAEHVEEIHAVVFARARYGDQSVQIAENAWSHPTGSKNTARLFLDAYRIGKKILQEKGEWVISAQDPFESGLVAYALARATGTPFLLQEHGDFFSLPYWRRESLLNMVRFVIGGWLLKRANHVRVVSERIKRTLVARGVSPSIITVTPVYTDTRTFEAAEADSGITYLQKGDLTTVLSMARFVPQKNLPMLIDAFRSVLARGARARLVLVGQGPDKQKLIARAQDLMPDKVTFLDWTDNPAGAIKAADVYALSSHYEGWGRVCIETLAAGTPLVMTDVGCAGEVVHNKKNGLVVPVNDKGAFAEALYQLITDNTLRKSLREAGRYTASNLPTFDENVALYIQALETCRASKTTQNVKE
jgi:glycosyltransferase involved in cell wall biosynthesis